MIPRSPALLWPLVVLTALALVGCENSPKPPADDFRPRTIDPGIASDDPRGLLLDSDSVRWLSKRIAVPLGYPLEPAWDLIDQSVLDDLSRAVWNGNGLRVGVIPVHQTPALAPVLGPSARSFDTHILSYSFPEEIRESRPLRAEFFADLTIPPQPQTIETFSRGRLRMLMASQPLAGGHTRVTLTPQHYRRQASLITRTPQERQLDGRVFDELAVEITVGPHQVLALGFYPTPSPESNEAAPATQPSPESPPTPPTPGNEPATVSGLTDNPETTPDAEDEPTQTDAEEEPVPLPPLNLGRGLFTNGVTDQDSQYLLLLRPVPASR